MKKILMALLALGSISLNAMTLEKAIILDETELIKKALVIALKKQTVTCEPLVAQNDKPEMFTHYKDESDFVEFISAKSTTIIVSEDLAQPVITALNYQSVSFGKYVGDYKTEFKITTSEDFKEIRSVKRAIYELISEEKNIGTLVDPEFIKENVTRLLATQVCN